MKDHYAQVLKSRNLNFDKTLTIKPVMVVNKIFHSKYKEIHFDILSFSELRKLLNKRTD